MSSSKTKKKSSHSHTPKTPAQAIKSDFKSWKKKKPDSDLTLEAVTDVLELKFGNNQCTLTFPETYPSELSGWYFFTENEDAAFQSLSEKLNDFVDTGSLKLAAVLNKMVELIDELGISANDGEVAEEMDEDPFAGHDVEEKVPERKLDAIDQEVAELKFAHSVSDAATLRLIQDLKSLKRSQSKCGFSAEPTKINGKANLYHWEVRLFDFEGLLATDLQQYKRQCGKDYVVLHLRFSGDYPYKPPFVRVVEPVFKFRTGHVTLGGAICMELLTNTGWKPFNDIEQIIVQIRAEIGSPGEGCARLDFGQSSHVYSENEAWQAFYRAAANHGWDTRGLGAQMFPTI